MVEMKSIISVLLVNFRKRKRKQTSCSHGGHMIIVVRISELLCTIALVKSMIELRNVLCLVTWFYSYPNLLLHSVLFIYKNHCCFITFSLRYCFSMGPFYVSSHLVISRSYLFLVWQIDNQVKSQSPSNLLINDIIIKMKIYKK